MKYQLYKEENYKLSKWTGGMTKELAIYPKNSAYLERNFIWRLSSATCEQEESDFSKLPDYDRVLMVLEGEVVLSHHEQRVARLKELEQDRFDGAYRTRSFGKITDYNLMVRKGNDGFLDLIYPEEKSITYGTTEISEKPKTTHALYCKEGYFVASFAGETVMTGAGQLLVLDFEEDEKAEYKIMGEGVIIRAQIFFDEMEGQLAAEVIPRERASFDDFKACVYLSNVQFRSAKYFVKKLKTQWFDQELSAAIRKVEKFYLTTIALVIGVMGIAYATIDHLGGFKTMLAFLIWIIVDCLVVSPLIYMIFMPKPVRKHIKDIDKLTPYEQRVRDEELGRNERLEKIMKKYKNSGRLTKH